MPKYRYNGGMSMILGQRLKELRLSKHLSQGQVAEYATISQSSLSDIERGQIAPKTLDVLVNLAEYFQVSTDYLLGLTDDPRPRDAPALDETVQEMLVLARQLAPARQRDVLRIIAAFIEEGEPGPGLAQSARDRALKRGDTPPKPPTKPPGSEERTVPV
jgi:transcriptional regulator with XRE-family HTH domain